MKTKATTATSSDPKAEPKGEYDDNAPDSDPAPDSKQDEDNSEEIAACAEACRAASASCSSAIEALDAAADELEAGNDSVSALTSAENACAEATTSLEGASSKCSALRGATAETDAQAGSPAEPPPPAPAPTGAAASVAQRIEIARMAAIGRAAMLAAGLTDPNGAEAVISARLKLSTAVLTQLGQKDPVRARGVLGARLARAAEADKLSKELKASAKTSETARREKLWEGAVADGRIKLAQAFTREESAEGAEKRVYAKWAAEQNTAYPELAAFEGWIGSLPRGAHAADDAAPAAALGERDLRAAGAGILSKRDIERAKRDGVDPEVLATVKRAQARGTSPKQEEGV